MACTPSPQHRVGKVPGLPGGPSRSEWAARISPVCHFAVGSIVLWWHFLKSQKQNTQTLGWSAEGCMMLPSCIGWSHPVSPCLHLPTLVLIYLEQSWVQWAAEHKRISRDSVGRTMKDLAKKSELTAAKMYLADISFLFTSIMQTFFLILTSFSSCSVNG